MTYNEMNLRQKKAYTNIKYAAINLIGGLENALSDYDESDEYYQDADELLSNHKKLVNEVYEMSISGVYREGFEGFGRSYESAIRDIRLCGREFLMAVAEERVCEEGY